MRRFADISVRSKLLGLMILASILSLMCVAGAVILYEETTFQPRVLDGLYKSTGLLTEILPTAMDFRDPEGAERYLRSYCAETRPDVAVAALFDAGGHIFAAYARPGFEQRVPLQTARAGVRYGVNEIELWLPLRNNAYPVGILYMLAELPPLYNRLPQYAIMVGAVLLALAVVAAVLLRGARQNLLRPLSTLLETTAHVTERDDYSVRVGVPRNDELGRLAAAFNRMIEVIGQRDSALRQAGTRIHDVFNATTEVAIIATDPAGTVTIFNTGAERMLGYSSAEAVGRLSLPAWHKPAETGLRATSLNLPPQQPRRDFEALVAAARRGRPDARTWTVVRKDGGELQAHMVVTAMTGHEGEVTGFLCVASDITSRAQAEEAIRKANRQLRMLGDCNQALIRATEEAELLETICEIIVDAGGYRMAWVGYAMDDAERTVRPMIGAGYVEGFLDTLNLNWGDTDRGRGPIGTAIRTGRPCAIQNIQNDPHSVPWAAEAIKRGYAAVCALPLVAGERRLGALSIYSTSSDAFDTAEVALLSELVNNLAFGIMTLRAQAERRRAEEQVRERERNYRDMFNSTSDALFVHEMPGGRLVDVNDAMLRMYGYEDKAEVLASSMADLSSNEPNYTQEDMGTLLRHAIERAPQTFEWHARGRDGRLFWVEVALHGTQIGGRTRVLASVRDISERRRAAEELARREEHFRSLIENASDMITATDETGMISYQSPSSARMLGISPSEMVGRNVFEYIHPEDLSAVREAMRQAFLGNTSSLALHVQLRHMDGSWRRVEIIGRGQPGVHGHPEIILNSRDVTETARLEEQFRQSQKMEAIGQLSGGVAHDFNNILTVIHGHVQLLECNKNLPPVLRESTAEISRAAERAANLTRQLLTFSRRQAMQQTDVDLNELVGNMSKMLRRILGEDVKMQLHYASLPVFIRADVGMIEQVLLNLSVNARDAMPKGGELVIATDVADFDDRAVQKVERSRRGSFAVLRVNDNGCGIPPEVMSKMFEPFFTTKDVGKGTGLGLATAYSIVEQHKGWINVHSELGRGSTFIVYLPRRRQQEAQEAVQPLKSVMKGGSETILLVEDEEAVRSLISRTLAGLGYRILEAPNGHRAVDIWREKRDGIDLLLTDMVMPEGIGGTELAQVIHGDNPSLPVIFASGYSAQIARGNLPLTEGENFLTKPFTPMKLADIVRASLDRAARREASPRAAAPAPAAMPPPPAPAAATSPAPPAAPPAPVTPAAPPATAQQPGSKRRQKNGRRS